MVLFQIPGGSVISTWSHKASRSSVWAAILFHITSNYAGSLVWMSFDGGTVDRLAMALASVGLAAVLVGGSRRLKKEG
jgi:hypothetical protein